jgi:hypothetical protein
LGECRPKLNFAEPAEPSLPDSLGDYVSVFYGVAEVSSLAQYSGLTRLAKMNFNFSPQSERQVEISDDGNSELTCPDCGFNNLHQTVVKVFNRSEDQDGVLTTVEVDGSASVKPVKAQDIPGRRDALNIEFWCEHCTTSAPPKVLRIMQHKGSTLVEWTHPKWVPQES